MTDHPRFESSVWPGQIWDEQPNINDIDPNEVFAAFGPSEPASSPSDDGPRSVTSRRKHRIIHVTVEKRHLEPRRRQQAMVQIEPTPAPRCDQSSTGAAGGFTMFREPVVEKPVVPVRVHILEGSLAAALRKAMNPSSPRKEEAVVRTPKRRGRPPKIKTMNDEIEVTENVLPLPKRRGRPPKVRTEVDQQTDEAQIEQPIRRTRRKAISVASEAEIFSDFKNRRISAYQIAQQRSIPVDMVVKIIKRFTKNGR